jgi:hypothetical protein
MTALRWARVTVAVPVALVAGALAAACTSGEVMLGTDRPPIADAEVPFGDDASVDDSGFFGDDASVDDGGFLDGSFLDGSFLDGGFLDGGAG